MITRTPAQEAEYFEHEPLDTTRTQIRLLRIQPYRYRQMRITCNVEIFDLSQAPAYQALSYEWGPEHPNHFININGKLFSIRTNLWDFLDILCKRKDTSGCYFWIDQICIDQTNIRERSHQVQLMGSIYSNAAMVLAWLGLWQEGFSDVSLYVPASNRCHTHSCEARHCISCVFDLDNEEVQKHPSKIRAFASRSYWNRLWIVQEVVLAEEITFCIAHGRIPKRDLMRFIDRASNYGAFQDIASVELSYIDSLLNLTKVQDSTLWSVIARLYEFPRVCSSDPRDLIYGLLGLVSDCHMIEVDYTITSDELFGRLLETLFSDMMRPYYGYRGWPHWPSPSILAMIGRRLGLPSRWHDFLSVVESSEAARVLEIEIPLATLFGWSKSSERCITDLHSIALELTGLKHDQPSISVSKPSRSADHPTRSMEPIWAALSNLDVRQHFIDQVQLALVNARHRVTELADTPSDCCSEDEAVYRW